jgi:hypothetical protein
LQAFLNVKKGTTQAAVAQEYLYSTLNTIRKWKRLPKKRYRKNIRKSWGKYEQEKLGNFTIVDW